MDPEDPARQFSFVLQVDDLDRYEVCNCEPSLDASVILEATKHLNDTDDMSYLVRKMRKFSHLDWRGISSIALSPPLTSLVFCVKKSQDMHFLKVLQWAARFSAMCKRYRSFLGEKWREMNLDSIIIAYSNLVMIVSSATECNVVYIQLVRIST